MKTEYGFDITLNYKCNLFGECFKLAQDRGYDIKIFVKQVMTNKKLDWLFESDDVQEWCDEYFFLSVIEHQMKLKKSEDKLDDFFLWFAGYLYKYWMNTRKIDRKEIYKMFPLKELDRTFAFYHTQDWDFIINEVTDEYNKKQR